MSDIENRGVQVLSEILSVSSDKIVPDLAIGDIPEWDSLAQARILVALEQVFGLTLDIEDVLEIESVQDIFDLLHERTVG